MRTLLHRLLGLARARGFDAAGGGRRWEGARTVDGLNAAILAGATTAARRAGWYARNNPWVAAAVDSLVGNVVGAGITYSSIRAGLIEFRRRVEQLQHNVVVHLFCRPVWERFVRLAVLTGDLPARDFDRNPDAYLGCEWLPPKFDYVDPMKDVQAEIMAIGAGLKSRSQAISERGYDAEHVDAEIAADRERANGLGLAFGQTAAPQQKEAADG